MAAPTLVATYQSTFDSNTSPKSVVVSVLSGDLIVYAAKMEDSGGTLDNPTAVGNTFTSAQQITAASYCQMGTWTAVAAATNATLSVEGTRSGTIRHWGFTVEVWRSHGGVGASGNAFATTAAPALALTTTGPDSGISVAVGDWTAIDGATRTWRTGAGALTEVTYYRNSVKYAVYHGYHANAGAVGLKTLGLTVPSNMKYAIIGLEILGTGGATADVSSTFTATRTATAALRVIGAAPLSASVTLSSTATANKSGQSSTPISVGLAANATVLRTAAANTPITAGLTASATFVKSADAARGVAVSLSASASVTRNADASRAISVALTVGTSLATTIAASRVTTATLTATAAVTVLSIFVDSSQPIVAGLTAEAVKRVVAGEVTTTTVILSATARLTKRTNAARATTVTLTAAVSVSAAGAATFRIFGYGLIESALILEGVWNGSTVQPATVYVFQ